MGTSPIRSRLRRIRGGLQRILIVEDDPAIGLVLREVLQLEGFEVEHVTDGLQAMGRLMSNSYDAVVLDVMLPGRDGVEILKAFRQKHGTTTPVIMLTAMDDDSSTWKGWSAGCDLYLTKPFEPDQVVSALRRLLAA